MNPAVRVARPRFQEEYPASPIFGEPVRNDAARRTRADDYVIKTSNGSPFGSARDSDVHAAVDVNDLAGDPPRAFDEPDDGLGGIVRLGRGL
jgi:hypothetical protein